MALSSAVLTAQEVLDASAKHPLLSGVQAGENNVTAHRWTADGVMPCGVAWGATTGVLGQMCDSTTRANQLWRVTTGGTKSGAEPVWPASPTPGVTTQADNTVVWTYQGNTADDSAVGFQAYRAFDRHGHLWTKPTTARIAQYLCVDLGASYAGDIDLAEIIGNNLGSISGDGAGVLSWRIECADDSAFVTGKVTPFAIANITASTKNPRLPALIAGSGGIFGLAHTGIAALRYTNARYWRLTILRGAGVFIPQIGEFWLGRRRQMTQTELLGFDPTRNITDATDYRAAAAVTQRYIWSSGQTVLDCQFIIPTNAEMTTLDSWWSECGRGKASLFVQDPTAPATASWIMLSSLDYQRPIPATTPTDYIRTWNPSFTETDSFQLLET
jgi:hypothetical protein